MHETLARVRAPFAFYNLFWYDLTNNLTGKRLRCHPLNLEIENFKHQIMYSSCAVPINYRLSFGRPMQLSVSGLERVQNDSIFRGALEQLGYSVISVFSQFSAGFRWFLYEVQHPCYHVCSLQGFITSPRRVSAV